MTIAYIGLGSNLNYPYQQLSLALEALQNINDLKISKISRFWVTQPWGEEEQAPFLNAVIEVQTTLLPEPLLDTTQSIESEQGRIRASHWGPRTLDLDLLFYGDVVINTERLVVPHPFVMERLFVLKPLSELAPGFVLPNHESISKRLRQADMSVLRPCTINDLASERLIF